MKKQITLIAILLCAAVTFAQEKEETIGWTKKGNISLLFNQSAFSDWVAGGENNIAGNLGINYDFNYKGENSTWDNRILASYGLTKSKNSEFLVVRNLLEFFRDESCIICTSVLPTTILVIRQLVIIPVLHAIHNDVYDNFTYSASNIQNLCT